MRERGDRRLGIVILEPTGKYPDPGIRHKKKPRPARAEARASRNLVAVMIHHAAFAYDLNVARPFFFTSIGLSASRLSCAFVTSPCQYSRHSFTSCAVVHLDGLVGNLGGNSFGVVEPFSVTYDPSFFCLYHFEVLVPFLPSPLTSTGFALALSLIEITILPATIWAMISSTLYVA